MNIQVFNNSLFGNVRFVEVEGKPYAVAKDIAVALGYGNPRDAISRHCKGVVKHDNFKEGGHKISLISEGDIYRLIIGSHLPQAEKFEKWVFDEVLPQIRQTGGYIPIKEEDDEATIMAKALMIAQKTIEKKDVIIGQLTNKIEEDKPKVDRYERFLNTDRTYTSTQLAKAYGVSSAIKLNRMLKENRIAYNQGKTWFAYANIDLTWYEQVFTDWGTQLRWTAKGAMEIAKILGVSLNIEDLDK